MPGGVPAVSAAIRVLERLAQEWPHSVSPGVMASELEINRSTCYNILAALQGSGWAISRGDRAGWSLGPRLLSLVGVPAHLIAEVAQEEIDALSRRLGFVVFLAERDGSGSYVAVAKAEHRSGVRVTVGVGDTFPFSAPALMQAFCAWLPTERFDRLAEREGIVAFTEHTLVDRKALHESLVEVRERGFSTSIRQFDLGQGAVAAPVFDSEGRATMAVCTLGFYTQLRADNMADLGKLVRECADRITLRTGGANPSE